MTPDEKKTCRSHNDKNAWRARAKKQRSIAKQPINLRRNWIIRSGFREQKRAATIEPARD